MRPALSNKNIQANFEKANKDCYKQRRNYSKAGFTNFSKKKIKATDKLNNVMISYKRGPIFRTLPNEKYGLPISRIH